MDLWPIWSEPGNSSKILLFWVGKTIHRSPHLARRYRFRLYHDLGWYRKYPWCGKLDVATEKWWWKGYPWISYVSLQSSVDQWMEPNIPKKGNSPNSPCFLQKTWRLSRFARWFKQSAISNQHLTISDWWFGIMQRWYIIRVCYMICEIISIWFGR